MEPEKPRWPFDPLQPGDHEPVRLPDDHPAHVTRQRGAEEPKKEQT